MAANVGAGVGSTWLGATLGAGDGFAWLGYTLGADVGSDWIIQGERRTGGALRDAGAGGTLGTTRVGFWGVMVG